MASLKSNPKTGEVQPNETKKLFSKLLGIAMDDVSDDHPEVVSFARLSKKEKIDTLMSFVSKAQATRLDSSLFLFLIVIFSFS